MDDRNEVNSEDGAIATGMDWASRITAVSLEMVVPGVLGWWLDGRLGTGFLLTLLGFGVGLPLGIWHLLRMTSAKPSDRAGPRKK